MEIYPKCDAVIPLSKSVYNRRLVVIKDVSDCDKAVLVRSSKSRFWSTKYKRPFEESSEGMNKDHKITQRLKGVICWVCESVVDLERV